MRRFLSTILYLFLGLPLALSALFLIAVRPWVLDREIYKKIVTDDRVYAALRVPEIAKEVPELIRLGDGSYDGPALVAAIQKNLPVADLKRLGTAAVDASLDAVEKGGTDSASLDLRPLKAVLEKNAAAVARDYVAALPEHSGAPEPGDYSYLPAGLGAPAASAKAASALGAAIDAIPDSVSAPERRALLDTRRGGTRIEGVRLMLDARGGLSQALLNRMTAVTAALSGLLIAGLGALGAVGLGRRLSRAGRYLLIPSVFVLAVGAMLAIPGGLILQGAIPEGARAALGGEIGAQLRAFVAEVLGPVARSLFLTGLVGSSIGGLLVSARRIAEPKEIE